MTWLLKLFPGQVWIYAAVLASAFTMGGTATYKLQSWRFGTEIQSLKAQHAQAVADANKLALTASETYRREEQRLSANVKGAENVLKTETVKNAAIAASLRADNGRLRSAIAGFATGTSSPTDNTSAACRDRSEKLGTLLESSLLTSEASAGDGESCESNVRALLSSWPKN